MVMNGSILLVDDEPNVTSSLSRLLRGEGYTIHQAYSGDEGLKVLAHHPIDVIVSDQRMPGMMGSDFLAKVQQQYPRTIRILLSGYSDFQSVVDAINLGAIYKFWPKPWDDSEMRHQIALAFAESKRVKHDQQSSQVLESTIEGVIITDADGVIESVNRSINEMTGFTSEELVGRNFFSDCWHVESPRKRDAILNVVKDRGEWQGQLCNIHKEKHSVIQKLSITGFRDTQGELSHLGILLLDITEQKEQELKAAFLAHYDEATGLPNKRLFKDRLNQVLNTATYSQSQTAIISLDIQRFNDIVKNLGAKAGEKVITETAGRIQELLPDTASIASSGANELVILLAQVIHQQAAEAVIFSILKRFEEALVFEDHELYLRFTMGLAIAEADSVSAEMLLQYAETAKQEASLKGQVYRIHAGDMDRSLQERWVLEHALPKALENDELQVVYQPKLDMNGRIHGMEALLRWRHPELGEISPDKFIPIAEETGLISNLGKWCLYTACEQSKLWHAQGFDDLRLAVNLSAHQMRDPNFYDIVESTLISLNYPPQMLELEVTESALLDEETAKTLMRRLRCLGVGLAADDFGTGYASIDYIKRFPFTTLKIDRSFINDVLTKQGDAAIIESIFMLAGSLGLNVVAEGVENQEQYQFLRQKGCDLVQGHYFSKALNIDDFTALLNDEVSRIAM